MPDSQTSTARGVRIRLVQCHPFALNAVDLRARTPYPFIDPSPLSEERATKAAIGSRVKYIIVVLLLRPS